MNIVKGCHLAAMAAVVSVAAGQSPPDWSNTGSTGHRAETALYRLRC